MNRKRMLIVDDAQLTRTIFVRIFGDEFDIDQAEDGNEALALMQANKTAYSIVLLDLLMPNKSGIEVIEEMQADTALRNIPIIVVSAAKELEREVHALELGALDYIVKPIDPRIAKIRVRNVLRKPENDQLIIQNKILRIQKEEEQRYRTVLHQTGTLVAEYDFETCAMRYDEGFSDTLAGVYDDRFIINVFEEDGVTADADIPKIRQLFDRVGAVQGRGQPQKTTVQLRTPNGDYRWFLLILARMDDELGRPKKFILTVNDVHEASVAQYELQFLSEYDDLTGIYNKKTFYRKTHELLMRNQGTKYVIVRFDIDRFKMINERFGFEEGDRVLRFIAGRIRQKLLGRGSFARLDADVFALCFPYTDDCVERLRTTEESCKCDYGLDIDVMASYGLYIVEDHTMPVNLMLDKANLALRTIKGSYIRRFAFFDDDLSRSIRAEQEIIAEMNSALAKGQFDIYLQPKCRLDTGEITGAEALVRWMHPVKGVISPSEFIPVFERNGFIMQLDSYVWDKTCRLLKNWLDSGYKPLPVSVNISRMNLYNPNLCSTLIGLLEKYGLPASLLELEITESAYTDNPQQLFGIMRTLQAHGFVMLMDDFGSGYSSLNMLKDLPVDILKIDLRFLYGLNENSRGGSILTSVVRMARWLSLPVIVEGVETKPQADFLRSIGCNSAQGFYFYKPMPTDEFMTLCTQTLASPSSAQSIMQGFDIDSFWAADSQLNALFNSVVGALGIYELTNGCLEAVRVNDEYYELIGGGIDGFARNSADVLQSIVPEDRKHVLEALTRARNEQGSAECQYRRKRPDGGLMWTQSKARFLAGDNERSIYYVSMHDISNIKKLEQEVEADSESYALVNEMLGGALLDLNVQEDILVTSRILPDHTIERHVDEHYIANLENLPYIYPDDRKKLFNCITGSIRAPGRGEVEYRAISKGNYQWRRLSYLSTAGPDGKVTRVVGRREELGSSELTAERFLTDFGGSESNMSEKFAQMQMILDNMIGGVALLECLGKNARTLYVNKGFFSITGYSLEEFTSPGANILDFVQPDDLERMWPMIEAAITGGTPVDTVVKAVGREGTLYLQVRAMVIPYAASSNPVFIAVFGDVTKQSELELSLEKDRSLMHSVMDNLPCANFCYDAASSRFIYVGLGCYSLLGCTAEEFSALYGDSFDNMIYPEDRLSAQSSILTQTSCGDTLALFYRVKRADGSLLWVYHSARLIDEADGGRAYYATAVDMTKWYTIQEENRRLAGRLEVITQNIPGGLVIYQEKDGAVAARYFSKGMCRLTGYPRNELEPLLDINSLAFAQEDERDRLRYELTTALAKNRTVDQTYKFLCKDGSERCMLLCANTAEERGKVMLLVMFIDITKQHQLEKELRLSEERYRLLAQNTNIITFDYDVEKDMMSHSVRMPDKRIVKRLFTDFFEYIPKSSIIHPDFKYMYAQTLRNACKQPVEDTLDYIADYDGAGFCWCRSYYVSLADAGGSIYRVVGRVVNISREKQTEDTLKIERSYHDAILAETLFTYEYDLSTKSGTLLHRMEGSEAEFFDYADYIAPGNANGLIYPEDFEKLKDGRELELLESGVAQGVNEAKRQIRILTRQHTWAWVEMRTHMINTPDVSRLFNYVVLIDAQKKENDALREKAEHDPLTGLLNREAAKAYISAYIASNPGERGALLIIDIDDFKAINDTYGHAAGDEYLIKTAQALSDECRSTDIVARLGGDEFIVFIKGLRRSELASIKAEDIRLRLQHIQLQGCDAKTTISLGVALWPEHGGCFDALYRRADEALYKAKGGGKNTFEVYTKD